jgi:hypothetical protein
MINVKKRIILFKKSEIGKWYIGLAPVLHGCVVLNAV